MIQAQRMVSSHTPTVVKICLSRSVCQYTLILNLCDKDDLLRILVNGLSNI